MERNVDGFGGANPGNLKCSRTAPPKFVHAMKTRSATKAPRVEEEEEAAEPLPLDKLAPEVLNIMSAGVKC